MSDPRADAVAALVESGLNASDAADALENILADPRLRAALLAVLLDTETLAAALHGTGGYGKDHGTCANWFLGWGDECGPDRHVKEAERIYARLTATDSRWPVIHDYEDDPYPGDSTEPGL